MKNSFLVYSKSILIILLSAASTFSQIREGTSAGIVYTSASVKNPWLENVSANSSPVEASVTRWSIPIQGAGYGGSFHYDFSSDFAGLILLSAFYSENTPPRFASNKNFSFVDIDLVSGRFSTELFSIGLPVLAGLQGGFGYMGTYADKKAGLNYFERGSYASYGLNASTNILMGPQLLHFIFLYNWVSMGDKIKGRRLEMEIDYFPFSESSNFRFTHIKFFSRYTTMNYPDKFSIPGLEYSDFQIGVGLMLNIIY